MQRLKNCGHKASFEGVRGKLTLVDVRNIPYISMATHPESMSMALELTVTAKGQVTLRRAVLHHLGVTPGAKSSVSLLEDGGVELIAAAARDDIKSLRGALRRAGQRTVSLEEMQEAIEAGEDRCRYECSRPLFDMGRSRAGHRSRARDRSGGRDCRADDRPVRTGLGAEAGIPIRRARDHRHHPSPRRHACGRNRASRRRGRDRDARPRWRLCGRYRSPRGGWCEMRTRRHI